MLKGFKKLLSWKEYKNFDDLLNNWKPIHLCWLFIKLGLPVPKYFIAGTTPPSVTTDGAINVTSSGARLRGTVTAEGSSSVTARGCTYALTSVNSNPEIGGTGVTNLVEGGTGLGSFYVDATGLSSSSGYSYKAYATSAKGTSYGSVDIFTTLAASPSIDTGDSITITEDVAVGISSNAPPTVQLNSPDNASETSDTTPDLTFTGTDTDNDDIEYEVQVDTVDTFDSSGGDIGLSATDRDSSGGTSQFTLIQADNPASESGIITSIEIYADENMTGCKVGTFYGSGTTYQCRSYATIGNVTAGSKQIFGDLNISVEVGDFIGIKTTQVTGGSIEMSSSGYTGVYYKSEDQFDAGEQTYTLDSGKGISLYGSYFFPLITALSETPDAGFSGDPDNTHPFASGQAVTYTVQSALTADTYYWRVKGKDPTGSDTYGAWSDTRSFTVTGGVSTPSPNVSDSITITEDSTVLIRQLNINVYDGLTITEDSVVEPSAPAPLEIDVNDSLTITEDSTVSVNAPITPEINVYDSLTLTEDVIVAPSKQVDTFDSITLTEDVVVEVSSLPALEINTSDTLTITESVTVSIPTEYVDVSDTLTISEDLAVRIQITIDQSEDITITEDTSLLINQEYISAFDGITLTEDSTVVVNAPVTPEIDVFDSLTLSEDTTVLIPTLLVDVSDDVTVTEDSNVITDIYVDVSESVTLTEDTTVFIPKLFIDANDQITVTESPTINIGTAPPLNIDLYEDITISEDTSVFILKLVPTSFDELTITEDTSISIEGPDPLTIDVYESVSITQDSVVELGEVPPLNIEVYDDLTITEDSTVTTGEVPPLDINVYDSLTATESVSAVVTPLYLSVYDSLTITENVLVLITTLFINVYEELTLTEDSTALIPTLLVNTYDELNITEDTTLFIPKLVINVNDQITISESPTIEVGDSPPLNIDIYDDLTITEDSQLFIPTLFVSASDDITLTEDSTTSVGVVPPLSVVLGDEFSVEDRSSNNNDLTNSGATAYTASTPFAASTTVASFVRSENDYLYITDANQTNLDITSDFTVEAWVNLSSMPSGDWTNGRIILSKWGTGQGMYLFYIDGDRTPRINFGQDGVASTVFSAPALHATNDLNTWIHLAFTVDISVPSAQAYRDGQPVTTSTILSQATSIPNGTGPFQVGGRVEGENYYTMFDGLIDEVRVWNDIRSEAEISANYNKELTGNEANLVAYYPFEKSGGESITITEDVTVELSSVETPQINTYEDITITEDSSVLIKELFIDVSESITLTEDVSVIIPTLLIDIFDELTLSEDSIVVVNAPGSRSIDVYDSITISEDSSVQILAVPPLSINVYDGLTLTENVNVSVPLLAISVSDTITITEDSDVRIPTDFINVSDTITITEDASLEIKLEIDTYDELTITEDSSVLIPRLYINTYDEISISEEVSVGTLLLINVSDDITITEDSTATQVGALNIFVFDMFGESMPTIIYDDKIRPMYRIARDIYLRL